MTSDMIAIFPSGIADCAICGCDVTADNVGAFRRLGDLGPNATVCLTICATCADTADEARTTPASVKQICITLPRRPIGSHPRRHPAYGKSLSETPPPGDALNVAVGWQTAKSLPAPLIVVQPEDNPGRLRFDTAAGRRVRVAHPADADPDRLLRLAQALIDYGALYVDLIEHPPRPGAAKRERLRVLVEAPR